MQWSEFVSKLPRRTGPADEMGLAADGSDPGETRLLDGAGFRSACVAGSRNRKSPGRYGRRNGGGFAVFTCMAAVSTLLYACCAWGDQLELPSEGLGYLTAPSSSPGLILRPSSIFLQPGNIRAHSVEGSVDVHWANVWCYEPDLYLLDGEWIRLETRLQYGLTDSLSMGLVLPVLGRSGGVADSMIEDFHRTFHLGNANREQFPQDQSHVWAKGEEGISRSIVDGDSWGIGDILIFAVLKRPDWWAAPTLMIQSSFPTGDEKELEGLGAPSLSLSTILTRQMGRSPIHLFAGIGVFFCPEDELFEIEFNRFVFSGMVGFEYRVRPSLSLVVQALSSSPVAKDFGEFSEPSHELGAGVKWQVRNSMVMEFAIVENLIHFKNSADIAAHFSVGRRL
jgi:Protein of unknown function (DUF3187)